MFENVVARFLESYLGPYIKNLSHKQLEVGVWSGSLILNDLVFKEDALDALNLPLTLIKGVIGQFELIAPWTKLQSEPVKIVIKDLCLVVRLESDEWSNDRDIMRRFSLKQRQRVLDAVTVQHDDRTMNNENASTSSPSFVATLIAHILDNLQIVIENIHISVVTNLWVANDGQQGTPTLPTMLNEVHLCFGVHIHSLLLQSTDDKGEPMFVKSEGPFVYKKVKLERFSVYFNIEQHARLDDLIREKSVREFLEFMTVPQSDDGPRRLVPTLVASDTDYLITPIEGDLNVRLKRQQLPNIKQHVATERIPKVTATLIVSNVDFCFTTDQYTNVNVVQDSVSTFFRNVSVTSSASTRPIVHVRENVRRWWRYALSSVNYTQPRWCLHRVSRYLQGMREYVSLYMSVHQSTNDRRKRLSAELYHLEMKSDWPLCTLVAWKSVAIRQLRQWQLRNSQKQNTNVAAEATPWNKFVGWFTYKKEYTNGGDDNDDRTTMKRTSSSSSNSYDSLTMDERKKLLQVIGIQLPDDDNDATSVLEPLFDLKLSFKSVSLVLLHREEHKGITSIQPMSLNTPLPHVSSTGGTPMLRMAIHDLSLSVKQETTRFRLEATLNQLLVEDLLCTNARLINIVCSKGQWIQSTSSSTIIEPIKNQNDDIIPLLQLSIVYNNNSNNNSNNSSYDFDIWLLFQPLDVAYSIECFNRVSKFLSSPIDILKQRQHERVRYATNDIFTSPIKATPSSTSPSGSTTTTTSPSTEFVPPTPAASDHLNALKKNRLVALSGRRLRIKLDITVHSPVIIIPEQTKVRSYLLFDMGKLRISSDRIEEQNNDNHSELDLPFHLREYRNKYDSFYVLLSDMQIQLVHENEHGDEVRTELLSQCNCHWSIYTLSSHELRHLDPSMVSMMTETVVRGELPLISCELSSINYEYIVNIGLSLTNDDDNDGDDGNTPRQQQHQEEEYTPSKTTNNNKKKSARRSFIDIHVRSPGIRLVLIASDTMSYSNTVYDLQQVLKISSVSDFMRDILQTESSLLTLVTLNVNDLSFNYVQHSHGGRCHLQLSHVQLEDGMIHDPHTCKYIFASPAPNVTQHTNKVAISYIWRCNDENQQIQKKLGLRFGSVLLNWNRTTLVVLKQFFLATPSVVAAENASRRRFIKRRSQSVAMYGSPIHHHTSPVAHVLKHSSTLDQFGTTTTMNVDWKDVKEAKSDLDDESSEPTWTPQTDTGFIDWLCERVHSLSSSSSTTTSRTNDDDINTHMILHVGSLHVSANSLIEGKSIVSADLFGCKVDMGIGHNYGKRIGVYLDNINVYGPYIYNTNMNKQRLLWRNNNNNDNDDEIISSNILKVQWCVHNRPTYPQQYDWPDTSLDIDMNIWHFIWHHNSVNDAIDYIYHNNLPDITPLNTRRNIPLTVAETQATKFSKFRRNLLNDTNLFIYNVRLRGATIQLPLEDEHGRMTLDISEIVVKQTYECSKQSLQLVSKPTNMGNYYAHMSVDHYRPLSDAFVNENTPVFPVPLSVQPLIPPSCNVHVMVSKVPTSVIHINTNEISLRWSASEQSMNENINDLRSSLYDRIIMDELRLRGKFRHTLSLYTNTIIPVVIPSNHNNASNIMYSPLLSATSSPQRRFYSNTVRIGSDNMDKHPRHRRHPMNMGVTVIWEVQPLDYHLQQHDICIDHCNLALGQYSLKLLYLVYKTHIQSSLMSSSSSNNNDNDDDNDDDERCEIPPHCEKCNERQQHIVDSYKRLTAGEIEVSLHVDVELPSKQQQQQHKIASPCFLMGADNMCIMQEVRADGMELVTMTVERYYIDDIRRCVVELSDVQQRHMWMNQYFIVPYHSPCLRHIMFGGREQDLDNSMELGRRTGDIWDVRKPDLHISMAKNKFDSIRIDTNIVKPQIVLIPSVVNACLQLLPTLTVPTTFDDDDDDDDTVVENNAQEEKEEQSYEMMSMSLSIDDPQIWILGEPMVSKANASRHHHHHHDNNISPVLDGMSSPRFQYSLKNNNIATSVMFRCLVFRCEDGIDIVYNNKNNEEKRHEIGLFAPKFQVFMCYRASSTSFGSLKPPPLPLFRPFNIDAKACMINDIMNVCIQTSPINIIVTFQDILASSTLIQSHLNAKTKQPSKPQRCWSSSSSSSSSSPITTSSLLIPPPSRSHSNTSTQQQQQQQTWDSIDHRSNMSPIETQNSQQQRQVLLDDVDENITLNAPPPTATTTTTNVVGFIGFKGKIEVNISCLSVEIINDSPGFYIPLVSVAISSFVFEANGTMKSLLTSSNLSIEGWYYNNQTNVNEWEPFLEPWSCIIRTEQHQSSSSSSSSSSSPSSLLLTTTMNNISNISITIESNTIMNLNITPSLICTIRSSITSFNYQYRNELFTSNQYHHHSYAQLAKWKRVSAFRIRNDTGSSLWYWSGTDSANNSDIKASSSAAASAYRNDFSFRCVSSVTTNKSTPLFVREPVTSSDERGTLSPPSVSPIHTEHKHGSSSPRSSSSNEFLANARELLPGEDEELELTLLRLSLLYRDASSSLSSSSLSSSSSSAFNNNNSGSSSSSHRPHKILAHNPYITVQVQAQGWTDPSIEPQWQQPPPVEHALALTEQEKKQMKWNDWDAWDPIMSIPLTTNKSNSTTSLTSRRLIAAPHKGSIYSSNVPSLAVGIELISNENDGETIVVLRSPVIMNNHTLIPLEVCIIDTRLVHIDDENLTSGVCNGFHFLGIVESNTTLSIPMHFIGYSYFRLLCRPAVEAKLYVASSHVDITNAPTWSNIHDEYDDDLEPSVYAITSSSSLQHHNSVSSVSPWKWSYIDIDLSTFTTDRNNNSVRYLNNLLNRPNVLESRQLASEHSFCCRVFLNVDDYDSLVARLFTISIEPMLVITNVLAKNISFVLQYTHLDKSVTNNELRNILKSSDMKYIRSCFRIESSLSGCIHSDQSLHWHAPLISPINLDASMHAVVVLSMRVPDFEWSDPGIIHVTNLDFVSERLSSLTRHSETNATPFDHRITHLELKDDRKCILNVDITYENELQQSVKQQKSQHYSTNHYVYISVPFWFINQSCLPLLYGTISDIYEYRKLEFGIDKQVIAGQDIPLNFYHPDYCVGSLGMKNAQDLVNMDENQWYKFYTSRLKFSQRFQQGIEVVLDTDAHGRSEFKQQYHNDMNIDENVLLFAYPRDHNSTKRKIQIRLANTLWSHPFTIDNSTTSGEIHLIENINRPLKPRKFSRVLGQHRDHVDTTTTTTTTTAVAQLLQKCSRRYFVGVKLGVQQSVNAPPIIETKLVTFYSRFVLKNCTPYILQYRQAIHSNSKVDSLIETLLLRPNHSRSLYFLHDNEGNNTALVKSISIRLNENGWLWVAPKYGIHVDEIGDSWSRMRNSNRIDEPAILRISTSLKHDCSYEICIYIAMPKLQLSSSNIINHTSNTMTMMMMTNNNSNTVMIQPYDENHPLNTTTSPYRIDNYSLQTLLIYQSADDGSDHCETSRREYLRPYHSCDYAWDEPYQDKKTLTVLGVYMLPPRDLSSTKSSDPLSLSTPSSYIEYHEIGRYNLEHIGVYPHVVIPEHHGSNEFLRHLSIEVLTEGNVRVLRIQELSSNSRVLQIPPQFKNEPITQQKPHMNIEMCADLAGISLSFVTMSPLSSSLQSNVLQSSIIHRSELLYLCISDMNCLILNDAKQLDVECNIGDIQVDNQLYHARFPVVFCSQRSIGRVKQHLITTQQQQQQQQPFLHINFVKNHTKSTGSFIYVPKFSFMIIPMQLNLEEDLLSRLHTFALSLLSKNSTSSLTIETSNDTTTTRTTTTKTSLYIESMNIRALEVLLTFNTSDLINNNEHYHHQSLVSVGAPLANIEDAAMALDELHLHHEFTTPFDLGQRILQHYIDQAPRQWYRLAGSSDILGNPIGLVGNVSTGVSEFIYQPFAAASSSGSPLVFVSSLFHGSKALFQYTVFGLANTTANTTGSVAQFLSRWTGDLSYAQQPRSLSQRISDGWRRVGIWGVLGVIVGGVGTIIAAPITGLVHLLSSLIDRLRKSINPRPPNARMRPPRLFPMNGLLVSYASFPIESAALVSLMLTPSYSMNVCVKSSVIVTTWLKNASYQRLIDRIRKGEDINVVARQYLGYISLSLLSPSHDLLLIISDLGMIFVGTDTTSLLVQRLLWHHVQSIVCQDGMLCVCAKQHDNSKSIRVEMPLTVRDVAKLNDFLNHLVKISSSATTSGTAATTATTTTTTTTAALSST